MLSATEEVGLVVSKKTTFEAPPPGEGLTTVTEAVLKLTLSVAKTVAVSFESLTKLVARALPFHFTVEPDTKPVPFTVSLKAGPPGTTASGLRGWLMRGTGFSAVLALTLMELELPVIDAVTVSVAVIVWPPTVFSPAGKLAVPFINIELAGRSACRSVLVKCAVPE
jgi:hypothetical protein